MQLLIIVIDIFPVKITLKDIINQKKTITFKYCSDVEHLGINQVSGTLISHLFVFLLQLQIIEKEKVFLRKIMASSYFIYLSFNLIAFGLHVK